MVLYFSGTGNSQFVAFRLAEMLGEDEAVSINRYLKSGTKVECRELLKAARNKTETLSSLIQRGVPFPETVVFWKDRMNSGPVCSLFYTFFVHDKGFAATDACVSCGKCAHRCPLNNIGIVNGKPVWNGSCTHCMACIGGCPTEAIEYKSFSKGKRRYYIMDDALCWGKGGKGN